MGKIHQPGHDKPENPATEIDTTKPEKECPICGDKSRDLPNHITSEHA